MVMHRKSDPRREAHRKLRAEWIDVKIEQIERETEELERETSELESQRAHAQAKLTEVLEEIKRLETEE